MAFDTVIDKAQLEAAMKASADAIREKTGDTADCTWDPEQGFAALIAAIESGGSAGGNGILMAGGEITPAENTNEIAVQHGLGVIPNFAFIFCPELQSATKKGAIKSMIVTPEAGWGLSKRTASSATTQTQAYYQVYSYYRVEFQLISETPSSATKNNPYCTIDNDSIHFNGTNYGGYTDYSEFITKKYYWLAVYNPNITYWSDFA